MDGWSRNDLAGFLSAASSPATDRASPAHLCHLERVTHGLDGRIGRVALAMRSIPEHQGERSLADPLLVTGQGRLET